MFLIKLVFEKFRNPRSYWMAVASNYGVMAVTIIVQLVLIPVYLSKLGTAGFGVVAMFLSLIDFAAIGVLWVSGGGGRAMAECAAHYDWQGFSRAYSLTGVIYTGYGIFIAMIFSISAYLFRERLFFYTGALDTYSLWLTVLGVSVLMVVQFNFSAEQLAFAAIKRHWAGSLLQAIYAILVMILVVSVLLLKSDVFLVFFCMAVSMFCVRILAWAYWRRGSDLPVQFQWPRRSSMPLLRRFVGDMGIRYATYGILAKIGQIDILLVGWLGGGQAAGLFALLSKIPDLCVQVIWRLATTAEPYFIHYDARGEHDRLVLIYYRGLRWAIGGSLFLGLLCAFFGQWLLGLWVGIDRVPNASLPYWLAGMAAFWIGAVRWPISYAFALVELRRLNGVMFIEVMMKLILIIMLFDRFNYVAPLWAVNLEFSLGVFILYIWLGRTVR